MKIQRFLLAILMVIVTLSGHASPKPIDIHQDTQLCVVDSYTYDIGVLEATGHNDGQEVERYLASTGLGKGYAWCAAFVNYHLSTCGVVTPKSPAWSPSWFTDNVIYHYGNITYKDKGYSTPTSGDVFGIYFTSKQRIAHVGFVDQWQTKKNTSFQWKETQTKPEVETVTEYIVNTDLNRKLTKYQGG